MNPTQLRNAVHTVKQYKQPYVYNVVVVIVVAVVVVVFCYCG